MDLFIRKILSCVWSGALLLVFTAGVSVIASDREKYLAAAGPTPIRLLMEAPRLDPMKALPRLRMSDAIEPFKAAEPKATAVREPIVNSVSARDEAPGTSPEMTLAQPLPTTTNNEPASQEPGEQFSPQMLLRYFRGNGTNEVLVPYSVDFTPPVPRRSGGNSKAVYIVQ